MYKNTGYTFKKETTVAGIFISALLTFSFLAAALKYLFNIMSAKLVGRLVYKQVKPSLISTYNQQYEDCVYKVRIRYLILNAFCLLQFCVLPDSIF